MHYFFYLSWLAQLIVGVGLLIISLLVHYSVIASLLNSSVVTFLLAAMLVTAKINTIIWHRYFLYQEQNPYSESIRWVAVVFKTGLSGLSMLCSVLYLVKQFAGLPLNGINVYLQSILMIADWPFQSAQCFFVLALLIALLIELGTLLCFEILTVSLHSLMQKQQRYELEKQSLKAQVCNRQQMDSIRHDADIDMIKTAVDNSVKKARLKMTEAS